MADLLYPEKFADRLRANLDYYRFVLKQYDFPIDAITLDEHAILDTVMSHRDDVLPMFCDVGMAIHEHNLRGESVLFEGAQGTMLDVDHGTYPFVTSSNCVAGYAAAGAGVGPSYLDFVLGIVKAYTTRVGGGPFPTELELADGVGEHLSRVGREIGTVTKRVRRCGWLDLPLLRRSILVNGVNGLCLTKLDVLDELPEIKICVGYIYNDKTLDYFPMGADEVAACMPIYKSFPGWQQSTVGIDQFENLPINAQHYIDEIENQLGVSLNLVSTGPDRSQTILRRAFQ